MKIHRNVAPFLKGGLSTCAYIVGSFSFVDGVSANSAVGQEQSFDNPVTIPQFGGKPSFENYVNQRLVLNQDLESYIVKRGDTLYGIARRYGISLSNLLENNAHLRANPNLIYPGQRVYLSGASKIASGKRPIPVLRNNSKTRSSSSEQAIKIPVGSEEISEIRLISRKRAPLGQEKRDLGINRESAKVGMPKLVLPSSTNSGSSGASETGGTQPPPVSSPNSGLPLSIFQPGVSDAAPISGLTEGLPSAAVPEAEGAKKN